MTQRKTGRAFAQFSDGSDGTRSRAVSRTISTISWERCKVLELLEEDTKPASRDRRFAQPAPRHVSAARMMSRCALCPAALWMDVIDLYGFVTNSGRYWQRRCPMQSGWKYPAPTKHLRARQSGSNFIIHLPGFATIPRKLCGREVRPCAPFPDQLPFFLSGGNRSLFHAGPSSYVIGAPSPGGRYACLQVSDEGSGIEPTALKRFSILSLRPKGRAAERTAVRCARRG